jgi:hypothetical protein
MLIFFTIMLAIVFLAQRRITREEKSAKSAPSNAGMLTNIHVFSSWMMKKALLAHGCAISAGTSNNIGKYGGNTFDAAAPGESREGSAFNPLWV